MATISTGYTTEMGKKMRSMPEIHARYQKCCQQYQQMRGTGPDFREQRAMVYAELKTLGWVLGKGDKQINQEANFK